MKRVGILCPSDTELAPLLAHIPSPRTIRKAMLTFYLGTLEGVDVVAVYSGVCKVNAAVAAQILVDAFSASAIFVVGTAGGMAEDVQLFDTVISRQAVYHDVADDILTEYHPWMPTSFFPADAKLLALAEVYGQIAPFPIRFGTIATGEAFIADEGRAEICQKFAPLCVDMETASVAHVCHVNGIPFLGVRSITDTATHQGIENFERNCEQASERAAAVAMGILALLAQES